MKKFLASLLLVSSLAQAAEIKIYDAPAHNFDMAEVSFGLNEKLERAWVNVHVSDKYDVDDMGSSYRVKVEGLTYDPQAKAAYLDIEGQLVECAVLRTRGVLVFRNNYLKPTNCEFKSKFVTRMVDDGFHIKKRSFLEIYLVTKE